MKLITLTQLDYNKTPIDINPDDISSIESRPGGEFGVFTQIIMKNRSNFDVKESVDYVKTMINK